MIIIIMITIIMVIMQRPAPPRPAGAEAPSERFVRDFAPAALNGPRFICNPKLLTNR